MNIVNQNGSLNGVKFKCNKTNMVYSVTGSKSTHQSGKDSPLMVIDTIKRSDGITKDLTRPKLRERFDNVTILK